MLSSAEAPPRMRTMDRPLWLWGLIVLLHAGATRALCGVTFLFPTPNQVFSYLDVVNVTYQSNFSSPALYTWCGGQTITQKALVNPAPAFNASVTVKLDFLTTDTCWFDLKPNTPFCGDNSPHFTILPTPRSGGPTTLGLDQLGATATNTAVGDASKSSKDDGGGGGGGGINTAAQAALGIGISLVIVVLAGGTAVFFWLRRQRRRPRAEEGKPYGSMYHGPDDKTPPLLQPEPPLWEPPLSSARSLEVTHAQDEAYYVGWSENLPGFYGSARESGSKHDIYASAPSSSHQHQPASLGSWAAPGYDDPTPPEDAAMPEEDHVPPEPTVELPGRESHRGYGQEFEMSTLQPLHQQQPYVQAGRELQEQKFLLRDMELLGLKKQPSSPPLSSSGHAV